MLKERHTYVNKQFILLTKKSLRFEILMCKRIGLTCKWILRG